MAKNQERIDDVKLAIRDVLNERKGVDEATHSAHHKFVADEIDARARRQEIRDKVRAQVMGWGLISILAAIGAGAYQLLKAGVKGT